MGSALPDGDTGAGRHRLAVLLAVGLPLGIGVLATAFELLHGVRGLMTASVQTPAAFSVHPPPPGTQLVWLSRNAEELPQSVRLHAFDWNGREVGTLALPCRAPCGVQASPDGQRVLVRQLGQTSTLLPGGPALLFEDGGTVFDAQGERIGAVEAGLPNFSVTWADDSRHLCVTHGVSGTGSTGSVQLDLVNPATATARTVTTFAAATSPQFEVLACSPGADRVVLLVPSDGCVQQALEVFQLSTGRLLLTHSYPSTGGPCAAGPLVQHDGSIVYEPTANDGTALRDLSTGTSGSLPRGSFAFGALSGLSWNGHRLVTESGVITSAGVAVWSAPRGAHVGLIAARPAGDDMLVFVTMPSGVGDRRAIVRGDGTQVAVPLPLD
jgi:hypothetical protein